MSAAGQPASETTGNAAPSALRASSEPTAAEVAEAQIESICRKYESFRLRDAARERYLMSSILQCGVREPLRCIQTDRSDFRYILLDGFKRLRCCCTLAIQTVPVVSLGEDEVASILRMVRLSNDRALSSLEQARFVDELHGRWGLSIGEIADKVERSYCSSKCDRWADSVCDEALTAGQRAAGQHQVEGTICRDRGREARWPPVALPMVKRTRVPRTE